MLTDRQFLIVVEYHLKGRLGEVRYKDCDGGYTMGLLLRGLPGKERVEIQYEAA